MRVAIVHDWLVTYGGGEKVLEEILALYPDADLYSTVEFVPSAQRSFLGGREVATSFIQHLPGARHHYRSYLPLMPLAVEQFDLSRYDLIVSSSSAVAKGVLTGPDQVHVSYVHTPPRYVWDLQHQYLQGLGLGRGPRSWLVRALLHYIRIWDARAGLGPDLLLTNSEFVARRIRKAYRREAEIIPPPVDVDSFLVREVKDDFYLTASRLVPYKRIDLIIDAFSQTPERRLVVIGEGPERRRLQLRAGPNIELLGYQPFTVLQDYMGRARGFVFAAEEDFGIVPVEAQACGTPVIAYGKGGVLETVRGLGQPTPTGVFFDRQDPEALLEALDRFEAHRAHFSPAVLRQNAERFSPQQFRERFTKAVEWALKATLSPSGPTDLLPGDR